MDRLACDRMLVAVIERRSPPSGRAGRPIAAPYDLLGLAQRIKCLRDDMDELDATIRSASGEPRGRMVMSVPITFGTHH